MSGKIKKEKCFFSFFPDNIIIYTTSLFYFAPIQGHYLFHSLPYYLSPFFLPLYCVSPTFPLFYSALQSYFFASKWVLTAKNLLIKKKRLLEIKSQMIEKKRTLFHHGLTTTPGRSDLSCSARDPMNNATTGTSFLERA